MARTLGAATLRLFFGRLHAEAWSPEALDTAAGNIARLADQHPGILFVFENHDGATLIPAVCRDIIARVNRPTIRMNFDPINFARVGVNAMDAFKTVEPWIGHMHLKGLEAGEFCEFGKGDVDLTPILTRLYWRAVIPGRFTVEWMSRGHNDGTLRLLQSVKLAQETL